MSPQTFDYSAIAGLYSQLAAVLAGFAFAGLVALLIAQLERNNQAIFALQAIPPLIATLIALIATSLDYAVVSGDKTHTSRATALETSAGTGFAVAGIMLFYSLLILTRGVERDAQGRPGADIAHKISRLLQQTLIYGVAPIVVFLVYGGTSDFLRNKYGEDEWFGQRANVVALTIIAMTIFGALEIGLRYWDRPMLQDRLILRIAAVAVAIAMVSTVATNLLVVYMSDKATQVDFVPLVEMLVVACFGLAASYSAARYRNQAFVDLDDSVDPTLSH